MRITLSGNPISTNHIYKVHSRGVYMTKIGKDTKESYDWQARVQWRGKPLLGAIGCQIRLYFGDKRVRDIDNYGKILFDSLSGIVWADDKQIQRMSVEKFYDKKNPRIELEVKEIP